METVKCPHCGTNLSLIDGEVYFCSLCGIGIPKVDRKRNETHIDNLIGKDKKITADQTSGENLGISE